jgi:GAF domain-containing protein/HAMP domain-containing protein
MMTSSQDLFGSRRERRGSLATRIRWAFLPFIVISLVVVGGTLIYSSYRAQQQALAQSQRTTAEAVSAFISSYLQATIREMLFFEQSQALATLNLQEQEEALESLLSYRGEVLEEVALVDSTGNEVVKVSGSRTYTAEDLISHADTYLFRRTMSGYSVVSSVFLSPENLPLVNVNVPVHDERGWIVGTLLAKVSIRQMWEAVAQVELGETGYAYIVDPEGTLLAHTSQDAFFAHQFEDLSRTPKVREALTGGRVKAPDVYQDFTGERVTAAYAPIEAGDTRWVAIVATPVNEAYTNIYNMLLILGGTLASILILAAVIGTLIPRAIVRPLSLLEEGANIIGTGNLEHKIAVRTRDEIGRLAEAFNKMGAQLHGLVGTLEQRVADRTHDLERRAVQLATAADVGRATASILEPEPLAHEVVELVRERFELYYAGLFLLDEEGRYAVLEAGTGEAGRLMREQGHRLEVGGTSMVGTACAQRRARLALDVGKEPVRFDNPLLPETRSEMALPLMVGARVLGALDVQSTQAAAFSEDDIATLQLVANQVAVAVQNARLFAEVQTALEAERRAYGEISRQAWEQLTRTGAIPGYHSDDRGLFPVGGALQPQMKAALQTGRTAPGQEGSEELCAPIRVRGQVIGIIDAEKPDGSGGWTEEEITLLEAFADQLGVALDSARLYQDTQRRAARERLAGEITARMRETLDMETVLKTAVREMGAALGIPRIEVRMGGGMGPPDPVTEPSDGMKEGDDDGVPH